MLKNFARLLAVAAFAVVIAAVPTTASAAGGGGGTGLNVTIGSATVQARILVTVPVTVTCTGPLADTVLGSGSVNVFIEQANGKAVSHGSGVAFFTFCSSSPQTINVLVTPDILTTPPSTAFHGGPAVATVFAGAVDPTFTISEGGSAGPQVIKL
jgi:hypothetical protein